MLDLGGDVGAAVVVTPDELAGEELEIRAETAEWAGEHVAVLPRPGPTGTLHAAVFPSLTAGTYRVRRRGRPGDATELVVEVTGARVTQERWPG
jgi:hypothetical protein